VYVLPPVPRCSDWASPSLISPSRISLPRNCSRVGLHIDLFGACSAFTRVAARTLAPSPIRDLRHRRLQRFCYLHDCSGCFRLERLAGRGLHPLESAAFPRRTQIAVIADGVATWVAAASVSGGFVASSAARARAASRSASLGPKEQREVAALRHARYFAQVLGSAGDLFQTGGDALQESLALFDRERTKRNCRAALGGSRDRRLDRARAIGVAVHRCGEPRPEFTAPPA
jgi:hypothetical protein